MPHARTRAVLLAAVLPLLATGCADDPTDPLPPPALTGRVLDAAGEPVAGAAVGLVYRLEETPLPGDWDKAATQIHFTIPEPGAVRLAILDHAGDPVRVLLDRELEAGDHAVVWDATDEAGRQVPAGMYHYVLTLDDGPPLTRPMLLYECDPVAILRAPHAVTDARGSFSIPRALIPTGEPLLVTDEMGVATDDRIATDVLVLAVWDDGGSLLSCGAVADLPPGVERAAVTLSFVPERTRPTFLAEPRR